MPFEGSDVFVEFLEISRAVAVGFLVMGFIGFAVKLVHIPINNILVGCGDDGVDCRLEGISEEVCVEGNCTGCQAASRDGIAEVYITLCQLTVGVKKFIFDPEYSSTKRYIMP
jgi:hypothetical protein